MKNKLRILTGILLTLILTVFNFLPIKADNTEWIRDDAGLLEQNEIQELNQKAAEISSTYNVGVYIRLENNHDGYSDIEDYAEALYSNESLGLNSEAVMLVITMDDRRYDILAHGDNANAWFTDYGKQEMADEFLPDLSNGDYYGAFDTFLSTCEDYMETVKEGNHPVDTWIPETEEMTPEERADALLHTRLIACGLVSPLIALLICIFIASRNRTSHIKREALDYIGDGLHLTGWQDIFLYQTRSVQHVPKDNDSGHFGGTSTNSGGFSHSSGSF